MVRALRLALCVFGLLLVVLVVRAARMQSHQVDAKPIALVPLDADATLERLRGGLRMRTISNQDGVGRDEAAFQAFRDYLVRHFPLTHARLSPELISGHSLLFHWRGSDPEAAALLLLAHQDVVPIDRGTESDWTHPPFAAVLADGYVWGRGSLDDKGSLFGILEAVESLLAEGFVPRQGIYLAFGHDEELGGSDGAVVMARLLGERGAIVGMVLDEGGSMIEGLLPGLDQPVAVVGVAEKGYLSTVLEVSGEGGHSSAPPPVTPIGRLAAAVVRIEQSPFPSRLESATRAFFEQGIGPESPFAYRLLYANLWLFGPVLRAELDRVPGANAMIRTTTAPTIFQAGQKDNVLPAHARAVVNFRVLPGQSTDAVIEHVRRVVADPDVHVSVASTRREPSTASRTDGPAWETLSRTIREVFPDTIVAPYLMVAGTDSRYYRGLCDCVYQFAPFLMRPDDLTRPHGTDERIAAESVMDAVRFYRRLIENVAGQEGLRRVVAGPWSEVPPTGRLSTRHPDGRTPTASLGPSPGLEVFAKMLEATR